MHGRAHRRGPVCLPALAATLFLLLAPAGALLGAAAPAGALSSTFHHGDDWLHLWAVLDKFQTAPPKVPVVYLLGGSAARECTIARRALERPGLAPGRPQDPRDQLRRLQPELLAQLHDRRQDAARALDRAHRRQPRALHGRASGIGVPGCGDHRRLHPHHLHAAPLHRRRRARRLGQACHGHQVASRPVPAVQEALLLQLPAARAPHRGVPAAGPAPGASSTCRSTTRSRVPRSTPHEHGTTRGAVRSPPSTTSGTYDFVGKVDFVSRDFVDLWHLRAVRARQVPGAPLPRHPLRPRCLRPGERLSAPSPRIFAAASVAGAKGER